MTTKRRMGQPNIRTPVKVAVDIRPGPSTPAMKAAWRKLFRRLIAECKCESVENEGKDGK